MPRILQCQCCPEVTPCNRCNEGPIQFVIDIQYNAGGGVIMPADIDGLGYGEISTTCDPDSCVTMVKILDGGTGYTTPPTVTFSGGTSEFVATSVTIQSPIVGVEITNGGSYTSRPNISLSRVGLGGRQIEPSELYAEIDGAVQTVSVTSQGSGYTEPPTVHFHRGGGGTGATATANISGGRVTSVTVTGGGSGYRYPPDVSFSGGGGSGAVATSAIRGPVDRVVIVKPGLYFLTTSSAGWPEISFSGSGGATATLQWSGKVTDIFIAGNCIDRSDLDFVDNPTVSFSGGGGEGAAAVAYSSAAETLVFDVTEGTCTVDHTEVVGFDTSSSNGLFPSGFFGGIIFVGEEERDYEAVSMVCFAQLNLNASFGFFEREAIWMRKRVVWRSVTGNLLTDSSRDYVLYVKYNAARVEPDVEFELADQPAAASQAAISATFEEAEDEWGRTYWKISDGTVVKAGDNLFPITTNEMRVARGNLFPGVFTLAGYTINWSYGVPTVAGVAMTGFLIQPELAVTFRPIAGNRYEIDTVAVVSGGRRESRPGLVLPATQTVPLVMDRGYIFSPPSLLATIADGEVVSVAIQFGTRGNFIPPAAIASIDPPEEPLGFWGGVDFDTRTTTYSQPDLEARADLMAYTAGGSGAEFAVTLRKETDANDRDFWTVDEIEVVRGGSGYVQDQPVRLWTGADTVAAHAAVARINLPERRAPTILGWSLPRGSEADFAFTIGAVGDGEWGITEVEILNGGFGYQNGDLIILRFGVDYEVLTAATGPLLYIQTDDDGTITGVEIARAGQFWDQPSNVASVTISRGGRYFKKVVAEVEIPIDVDCTTGAWEELEFVPGPDSLDVDFGIQVGDGYLRPYVPAPGQPGLFMPATRRCPIPTVSLSLQ